MRKSVDLRTTSVRSAEKKGICDTCVERGETPGLPTIWRRSSREMLKTVVVRFRLRRARSISLISNTKPRGSYLLSVTYRERTKQIKFYIIDNGCRVPPARILGRDFSVNYSDYATPITPVLKSNDAARVCIDYSVTLNKVLHIDRYALPMEDLFARLHGDKEFSKLDLLMAYTQLELIEDSQPLICINTHHDLLHDFLKTGAKWMWSEAHQSAFETVKHALESELVLAHHDPRLHTVLTVEASPTGLDAVLAQQQEDGSESDSVRFSGAHPNANNVADYLSRSHPQAHAAADGSSARTCAATSGARSLQAPMLTGKLTRIYISFRVLVDRDRRRYRELSGRVHDAAARARAPVALWQYPAQPWERVHLDMLSVAGGTHLVVDSHSRWSGPRS
ncbi:Uncharacterized protein K02A2.6 [Eumeta japonica]|uniref:Uncharacterized protein K02A2.6 n=1 Tax=Eumeta variegata TaxID=151549 RepID=A0A4C1Z6S1_EUMVA|nr:Uncharacterized protein K02A2.6 [Eumeta japonica]